MNPLTIAAMSPAALQSLGFTITAPMAFLITVLILGIYIQRNASRFHLLIVGGFTLLATCAVAGSLICLRHLVHAPILASEPGVNAADAHLEVYLTIVKMLGIGMGVRLILAALLNRGKTSPIALS